MREGALRSVVLNLLDNAEQHGGDGVEVKIEAEWSTGRTITDSPTGDRSLVLRITDNGPGISAANLDRIWDRFFTTARESGGTGLGLAIVRSLVERHGGRFECHSRPGRTEFRVALPAMSETAA